MLNNNSVKKVVIAGGGTAGWIAAATLSKGLGKNIEVCLVESDAIPTVGVGEATIPPLLKLHQILGIDEKEFMSSVNGTFKLGISFENWRDVNENYIHSFGYTGKDCWAAGFQHFWLAGQNQGVDVDYGDYCTEHLAARKNKFAVLPKNGMNYAYHIDAGLYAKFLRAFSEKQGVIRIEGKIEKVNTNIENGFIDSLTLASGETVNGDFFVDCTGFRALLIEQALHTGYEDWSHWLPCDRALAVQTELTGDPMPYTRSIARDAGWQWRIPLQSRMGNGLVYCSRYMSDDDAKSTLLGNLQSDPITEPRPIHFRTGTRRKHWNKNCVALGLASGFLEPLESTSIHLIQRSAIRLIQLFPVNGIAPSDIDEFNEQTKTEVERIRDFIILHYHVTNRNDSEFWRYCRNMTVPESLNHRIQLFKDTGRVFKIENELFGEDSWTQVMIGQGIIPKAYHPIVDLMSKEELDAFLSGLRVSVERKVDQLPQHQEFIDYYCKSTAMNK